MPARKITAPTSHPYIISIAIDPADRQRIERMIENSPELRLVDLDDRRANEWTIAIGCASERVRDAVEDGWG